MFQFSLRSMRSSLCALFGLTLLTAPALSSDYPNRPVRIVVPFATGAVTDTMARLIADHMSTALKQPFVVENRPGGGGLIGSATVARAPADGYTILLTAISTHSAAPALYKSVPYDPIKDFTPIARFGAFSGPIFAVHADVPAKTMQEFVAYAKSQPGGLQYGHGNSSGQIAAEAIKNATGIDLPRVSYRSNPQVVTDLSAGHIKTAAVDPFTAIPSLQAGKIRVLATSGAKRARYLPDSPTLNETVVPGLDLTSWGGMFAPPGTPKEIVAIIARELEAFLVRPDMQERIQRTNMEPWWLGPKEFPAYLEAELVRWGKMAKEAGIEPQ
jgi:tripartite-type tricarboxylate transporter receptor subunit TctC